MTGESCEMLSSPENARKEPAKPIRIVMGVSAWPTNMLGDNERNSGMEICEKTVMRNATSLRNAIVAPTRLTFALVLMPIKLRIPSRTRVPIVIIRANGSIDGIRRGESQRNDYQHCIRE